MNTLEQLNWFQLHSEFGEAEQVLRAEEYFSKKRLSDRKLKKLSHRLRHHEEESISNKETYLRDDLDQLLDYLSLIEVGFVAGALKAEDVLQPPFIKRYRRLLLNEAVRKYYEENYTLPLLVSFKSRLMGVPGYAGHGEPKELSGYVQLLSIKRTYEHDADLNNFLWILDGGWIKGFSWGDLLELADDLNEFREVLAKALKKKAKGKCSGRGSVVLGCRKFVDFLVELTDTLKDLNEAPELRQAIWLNYAYWFNDSDSDEYREHLEDLFDRFIALQKKSSPESEAGIRRYRAALDYAFSLPVIA